MNLKFPIAERELRIAARGPGFYRSRRNIAGAAILVFFWLYWVFKSAGTFGSGRIFAGLSIAAFLYALAVGVILTADCISSEKREGTLGLLFLTTLKTRDIVVGNLAATALKAFYGLLGAFPVLALSIILGGVGQAEFQRVCFALICALFFSISFSLLLSCVCKRQLAAASGALLGLFLFVVILPGVCSGVRQLVWAVKWVDYLEIFSPLTPLDLSPAGWSLPPRHYLLSVTTLATLSLCFLALSCLTLSSVWRDRPAKPDSKIRRGIAGESKTRRLRLLGLNPFLWLASRRSLESTRFLLCCVALAIATVFIGQFYFIPLMPGPNSELAGTLVAWSFAATIVHAALLYKLAAFASLRLAEDRKSGALELLLVSPLNVRRIVTGQWLAIARQFAGPATAAVFLHAFVFWIFLTLAGIEEKIPGGAIAVLKTLLYSLRAEGPYITWEVPQMAAAIVASGLLFAVHWIALVGTGMWIAMRIRRPAMSVWITLGIVLFPPLPLFISIVVLAIWMNLPDLGPYWSRFCIVIGFLLWFLNALFFIGYSNFRLWRAFRSAAADRFDRPLPSTRTRAREFGIRLAIGCAILTFLIASFYGEERWRGWRAWQGLEVEFQTRGMPTTTKFEIPPEIPSGENFGAAKIFKPLFEYTISRNKERTWTHFEARERLRAINLLGDGSAFQRRWFRTGLVSTNEPHSNWALGHGIDLDACARFYRKTSSFAPLLLKTDTTNSDQIVLRALSSFDPELHEIESASRLPHARFPLEYHRQFDWETPHRHLLMNIAEILALRATAKLQLDQRKDALSDIEFILRLSNAFIVEPGFAPQYVRRNILLSALQPLWEGLSNHQWKTDELSELQKLFDIDVLRDYSRTVQEEMILTMNLWNIIIDPDETAFPDVPPNRSLLRLMKIYPVGWKYLNQAGLLRLTHNYLLSLIDPIERRIHFERMRSGAVRASGVMMDPFFHMVVPKLQQLCLDTTINFAHLQTSLDEAVIACALERYRLKNAGYPEDLHVLVPEFLKQVPSDVMTGEPLKYKLLSEGSFVLYSVGFNQTDDRGKPAARSASPASNRIAEQDLQSGDWVWTSQEAH